MLIKECKPKNLILKLGDKGIFSCPVRAKKENQPFTIPSFSNNIVDAVGAGDALLAYATLSMVSSKSLVIASIISSLAASCECELDGNIPITAKDIIRKINFLEKS